MRKVAQGSPGQAALLRRPHALPKGGSSFERDDKADGGDRSGHTGLDDRVEGNRISCSATQMNEIAITINWLAFLP